MSNVTAPATLTFDVQKFVPAPVYSELTPVIDAIIALPNPDDMAVFPVASEDEGVKLLNALQRAAQGGTHSIRKRVLAEGAEGGWGLGVAAVLRPTPAEVAARKAARAARDAAKK